MTTQQVEFVEPGTNLATVPNLREFRKTNEAIGLRVSEGRLSLLSRKVFNILVLNAQQIGEPGKNTPINSEAAAKYYWILLSDVARDASFNSNDTELLKASIEELQNVRVYMEDDIQWTSEHLLSSVKLVNPLGLKKRGGQVWIGFAFPPEVESRVLNPLEYTRLSIYYQSLLRSGASLALYEFCRRYATNPSHLTSRREWVWWYTYLSGKPVKSVLPLYKYFKRDTLNPSIAEISTVTNIEIDLIEHKRGRKVADLQFKVYLSDQGQLPFPTNPVINSALLKRVMALGISQDEAIKLTTSYDEDRVTATLALMEKRMRSKTAPRIESTPAYFRQALKHNYAATTAVAKQTMCRLEGPATEREPIEAIRARYFSHKTRDAMDYYNEVDEDERTKLFSSFLASDSAKGPVHQLIKKHGANALSSPAVRSAFASWLVSTLWGESSSEEIYEFAITERADVRSL